MIPRSLIIFISVGVFAGVILGITFVTINDDIQLEFVEGSSISIVTEKSNFKQGEEITIKIINSGSTSLTFSDATLGLKITGLDGRILYNPTGAQVISHLEPFEEKIFIWNQIKNDGDEILYGLYKITSEGLDNENNIIKKSITINILK